MLAACRACARPGPELLHASPLEQTLTSESKLRAGRLKIHLCPACAHVMSDEGGLGDVSVFYGREYDSLLESAEADDLYDLGPDGAPIYRSQVQLENLSRLANLPAKGRLLDFGCGKGAFLARFQRQHPGWELSGCDVSERYRAFVEPLTGPGRFRVTALDRAEPPAGPYDLITMFFVAEHLTDPAADADPAGLAPGAGRAALPDGPQRDRQHDRRVPGRSSLTFLDAEPDRAPAPLRSETRRRLRASPARPDHADGRARARLRRATRSIAWAAT